MIESRLIHGEALEELRKMPSNSVDAIITDPPAGISFMGKSWDNFYKDISQNKSPSMQEMQERRNNNESWSPSYFTSRGQSISQSMKARDAFVSVMTETFEEALRVLKPGGHALVWSLPRTSHWTATALEDAGFEIRDSIEHIFGSGFPKSHDPAKKIEAEIINQLQQQGIEFTGWENELE